MNKHTPGPWMIYDNSLGHPVIGPDDGDGGPDEREAVAMVFARGHGVTFNDAKEVEYFNALLIAAAPDLLAALEDAEFIMRKAAINPGGIWPMLDSLRRSAEDARAAIAKARGQE